MGRRSNFDKKNLRKMKRVLYQENFRNRACPDCGKQMWSPIWGERGEDKDQATVDHIYPSSRLDKALRHLRTNLRLVCRECNEKKGDHSVISQSDAERKLRKEREELRRRAQDQDHNLKASARILSAWWQAQKSRREGRSMAGYDHEDSDG